ncbi:MAG: hypothetical protein DYG83_01670 [Candidatus Brocadia sp. AMX2]|uniref:Uncharacterized protein n=1 Tax=Candidatus Brocadia sinica JPN1 TaxID=1197129 RepID=A0ABQ0JVC8_9BACT|nr:MULTISPECIES: hypothetical protein [Brocadia]KXK30068.1 MAG: hypothetical protein UZ01_01541 [Candidatus Brocadia sinica]MBC6930859.1 hypothetical protein [Candidatus Brocadia sp.]MBL1167828.1 hypothetical protein [Candidatus Brocadia sp. AMX1]NOG41442.1 hypothetical protein [Planctomycetota bacterium]KAA0245504.1 MAG: hypothetical protein EDM70_01065 [Candidatus Brocadia sp. AMX2]
MKGDKIPDKNHIARYCKPTQVSDGQIQATAFMLRTDEESLSVNWLEFLNCSSRGSEIIEIRKIYSKKVRVGGLHAKIAVLNVGEVRKKVLEESPDRRKLEVLHDPAPEMNDPSHSGIYNLKQDDELIAELILETVREVYSARA